MATKIIHMIHSSHHQQKANISQIPIFGNWDLQLGARPTPHYPGFWARLGIAWARTGAKEVAAVWVAVPAALPPISIPIPMGLAPRSEVPRAVRHSHGKSCCSLFIRL